MTPVLAFLGACLFVPSGFLHEPGPVPPAGVFVVADGLVWVAFFAEDVGPDFTRCAPGRRPYLVTGRVWAVRARCGEPYRT